MNKWLRIGVPVLVAVLLITATVGITLAVTARSASGQAVSPSSLTGQGNGTQYARGPLCSNCAGAGQGAVTGDQDDATGSAYVPQGANCPSCPGYVSGTGSQTTTYRGGCCGGR